MKHEIQKKNSKKVNSSVVKLNLISSKLSEAYTYGLIIQNIYKKIFLTNNDQNKDSTPFLKI